MHPGEEAFYLPTSALAAQLSSVLGLASGAPVRGDQFDAVLPLEPFIEPVGVIGLVANEPEAGS